MEPWDFTPITWDDLLPPAWLEDLWDDYLDALIGLAAHYGID
jgi:hypothetical protein